MKIGQKLYVYKNNAYMHIYIAMHTGIDDATILANGKKKMKTSVSFNMKNIYWVHWCLCVGNCICSGEKCAHAHTVKLKLHFHCIQHLHLTCGKMIFENFPRWRLFRTHETKKIAFFREKMK